MLLQPCCPTPRARREAELPRKHARQVTLVGETGLRRRRREGNAVTNQHPPPLGCREGRHHVHIDIGDAPAPRGWAERPAVMNFTRIGCDDLAGVTAHDAAPTEPLLRAVFEEPESVRVVPVPAELLRAVDVRAVDALERGSQDTRNVLHVRGECLLGSDHASRVTYGPFAWLATSSLSPAGEAAGRPRDNERQTGCGGVANSGRVPTDLARRRCPR